MPDESPSRPRPPGLMLIVLDHDPTVEVYALRRDTSPDAYVHIAATREDALLREATLLARITDDGDCHDPLGQRIDALPFVRAFQAAKLARCAAIRAACPERVYFSAAENEAGGRVGLTAALLEAIEPATARNRLISLLFQAAAAEDFTYVVSFALQDGLDELGVPFGAFEAPNDTRGSVDLVLTTRGR